MPAQQARQFWVNLEKQAKNRPSDDLQIMLDLVWTHRKSHADGSISAGNADVYALYNRIFKDWSYAPGGMMAFLEGLAQLQSAVEVQCSIKAQNGGGKDDELGKILRRHFGAVKGASGFASMSAIQFNGLVTYLRTHQNSQLMSLLSDTFFHYRRNLGGSQWRVYLHVQTEHRARVMGWVLANVWNHSSNAKVGGPSRENRADNIVIYLPDQGATDVVLRAVRSFQAREENRSLFVHGVPRTTRQVQDLVGVGSGAEPPVGLEGDGSFLVMRRTSSSFGTYRQQLIELALTYTLHNRQSKAQFIQRVVRYFHMAGVDPAHPDRHVNIERLVAVADRIEELVDRGEDVPEGLQIFG